MSNPPTFPARSDLVILSLVHPRRCPASIFSAISLGLLGHYSLRLEAEIESAAAGYSDEAEGGRSGQEGGHVRHLSDARTAWLRGK